MIIKHKEIPSGVVLVLLLAVIPDVAAQEVFKYQNPITNGIDPNGQCHM